MKAALADRSGVGALADADQATVPKLPMHSKQTIWGVLQDCKNFADSDAITGKLGGRYHDFHKAWWARGKGVTMEKRRV